MDWLSLLIASIAVHHKVKREHSQIHYKQAGLYCGKFNPHSYTLEKNDDPDKFLVCTHTKAGRLAFSRTNMQTVPNNFAPRVTNTTRK